MKKSDMEYTPEQLIAVVYRCAMGDPIQGGAAAWPKVEAVAKQLGWLQRQAGAISTTSSQS
jgi:hypothetical protein